MPVSTRGFGLDCVRAIAISLVLLCHGGIIFAAWFGAHFPDRLAAGGFFGVELFFVLSGLLIGRILMGIIDRGASIRAWRVFLIRRWMRTLPLYYATLLLLAIVWPPQTWRQLPWYLSLSQNLGWGMVDNWFGVSWSLSVEEWFYLLFSSLLFAATLILPRRTALFVVTGLCLTAPAILRWTVTTPEIWDQVTSKLVFCRLDAIAFGIVAAWMIRRWHWPQRHGGVLLLLGCMVIGGQWFGLAEGLYPTARARQVFIFDVVSLGFALCLPFAVSWQVAGRGVLTAVVTWTSRLSYPLYLTHLSILEITSFTMARWHAPASAAVGCSVLGTVGLSYLLHRFLEQPIMAWRPLQPA